MLHYVKCNKFSVLSMYQCYWYCLLVSYISKDVVSDLSKLLNQHDFEENKCQQVKLGGTMVHSITLICTVLCNCIL